MASIKTALKAAKAALDSQKFAEAAIQAQKVLESEPGNYFANVFLGRALEKQGKLEEAASPYEAATKIKPSDELAWKGLCYVYQSQGSRGVDNHTSASLRLAEVYLEHDDAHQCQSTVDKLVEVAKESGSREQYKNALKTLLPSSPVYGFLEGRIQKSSYTYTKLAEITEYDEKEQINRKIGERRTRLGAKLGQVTIDVTCEVYGNSGLEDLYQNIIDWTADDNERRTYEEKLLQHAYSHLVAVAPEAKHTKREQVMKIAHGMVIIKHPFKLAWDLDLEWSDIQNLADIDQNTLLQYAQFFPNAGLSAVLRGFFELKTEPEPHDNVENSTESSSRQNAVSLSAEDRLELISDGLEDAKSSALAHRLAAQHFLDIYDYESCVDISRKAKTITQSEKQKSGLSFQSNLDAISSNLATSLVFYQSPKNHPEAKHLFNDILKRKPDYTPALLGIGLVYEEQQEYQKASDFLDKALARDFHNVTIAAEAAWCKALYGQLNDGLRELQNCLAKVEAMKNVRRELKSQIHYRIGRCLWQMNTDVKSRKDRKGPYANFISAIKMNPSFAPAYTSLGVYYQDFAKDRKRARQCLQKAFELSASEVVAAEYLARNFADDGDWDIVEIISQRVLDSGVVRPAPGSKRKAISWPFVAMAIVQMNKQDYPRAVVSFQSALRISPSDHSSWIGLGESYLSSGRYNAASRTLEHAQGMIQDSEDQSNTWFAHFMYANVRRELGDFEKAIAGYRQVLKVRPGEFGVSIALLQTLVESAWHFLESGHFHVSADAAKEALISAKQIASEHLSTVDFWKAVADSCSVFFSLPGLARTLPVETVRNLLRAAPEVEEDHAVTDLDHVTLDHFSNISLETERSTEEIVSQCVYASLLAGKQAVAVSSSDVHARSVAWYNLGWTEYHAHKLMSGASDEDLNLQFSACSKASVTCFQRAIELEASNADFWSALGVTTMRLNQRVAQHSFVRSLHLNERNPRTWTNLGVLYMEQIDHELAHEAFSRAQSIDPDYVDAWVGEGLVALDLGNPREALLHFTHAVEISDASIFAAKTRYVTASFDELITSRASQSPDLESLVVPLFALRQIEGQAMGSLTYRHMIALLLERTEDYEAALSYLRDICDELESRYEQTESVEILRQFIRSKCDLARNQLAFGDYAGAAENAETALDLSGESDAGALSATERSKARLSAHLTAGLAKYYLKDMDTAIHMFRDALQESDGDSDGVCLLSKVLWAKGGRAERNVSKEHLLDCVEHGRGSAHVVMLLGAIAVLEGDDETQKAVSEDLLSLRTSGELSEVDQGLVESLLFLFASISTSGEQAVITEKNSAMESIMLFPSEYQGWSKLADSTSESFVGDMALRNTEASVPPDGPLGAEQVSQALAAIPSLRNAQRSIMFCPSAVQGWQCLAECTS